MRQNHLVFRHLYGLAFVAAGLLLLQSHSLQAASGVDFDQMAFFEAGDDVSEGPPEDWDDPRFTNRFDNTRIRYIYTVVGLRNLRWQLEDQTVVIHLRYYHSDGRLFGNPVIDYEVPRDWKYAELWNGWGWPEAGSWEPDRYRVELWLNNRKRIGSAYFTVD